MSRLRWPDSTNSVSDVPGTIHCRWLDVTRSGFYAWRARPASTHTRDDRRLNVLVRASFEASQQRYGSPCGHEDLLEQDEHVSRKRVVRLMQEDELKARLRKRYKLTTMSDHDQPVAANLLDRQFEADAPNQRWVGDTTEFVIGGSGKLYFAAILATGESTPQFLHVSWHDGVDTQVFRLDEGPTLSTGSLLDAMKNLPGVTVDQEGMVSLRGSDRVAILIDGRQSSLTGVGQFSRQRDDLPTDLGSFANNPKVIPSVNLNYNTETVRSFFQGELLLQDDLPNNEFTTRFYDDGRVTESQVPENREQYHYIVRLGSDWSVASADTVSVSGIYDFETHTDRAKVPFILASTRERERFWFWREKEDTGFANVSVDWKRRFETPGHELGVNLQYTRGWEDEAYFLNEVSRVREGTDMTHLKAEENTLPLSIDYIRPLRAGRLELGTRLQWRWLPISYTVDRGAQSVIYEGLGDVSDWNENIVALYANVVREQGSYSLEAGVRVEQTDVSYIIPSENLYYRDSDRYDYLEVFPNARFTYRLNSRNRLVAAYNRRIDRPGEPELRIFPKYDDPELLKVGNPFLRPQLTNAMEIGFGHSWEGGSASTALYYRNIADSFFRIFAIDDSNPNYDVVNRVYENAGNSTQTGVELLLEQDISDPWQLSGSVNWFRNEIDAFETTLLFPRRRPFSLAASNDDTWDVTLNNRVQLPGALELQLSYIYYGARNVPQGRERARSSVDVAMERSLMNDRAELLFTLTDIFNDFAIEHEVDGQGFTALYQNFLETQVATLGLRVRF